MADSEPSPEPKGPTVAASANQCLESFQQCLFKASSVHPREVSMVEDQLARFSSWATSIGVFAPGSASMDHRLRYATEVQSVVTGLLESLNYRVQTCSRELAKLGESSTIDVSAVANERLGQSFLDIAAEITRLNKISNTIRRASKDTQVLKASNFQIKDDEGRDVEPLLLSHFEHHIGDWFPGISETIRQRLSRAMLLRRKRILYRRHRQGNTSIRSENTISQASVTLPDAQSGAVSSVQAKSKQQDEKVAAERPATIVAPSQVRSATTLAPEKFKMVSSSPSIVSASRTIASVKHQVLTYPPAPGFAAKRRYEKLKSQRIVEAAGTSTEPSLQELLESDLRAIGEITCPYCLYALPAAEVFDERKWQNHVKNDLDPYVCLFEDCDQPDVLYTHSDEWLGHLHQHGKIWRCSSHREMGPFANLEEYMRHMREVHDNKLSDRQLRVMANRNSRKASKLFPSCPLCGREESEVDGRLEDHLAGHLRSLALKSLPSYQDEIPDDVGEGNNSIDGSRPRSRSTLRELEEEKEQMLRDGAGSFWEHWTPQLTQGISVNFLGDVYLELDLSDNDARVASLFFDTMVFKESSANVDDDPILQSMLQQQLARIVVYETDDSSDLPMEREVATSSKAPEGETSGQDEAGDATTQRPANAEADHVQAATLGQDGEVDFTKTDEAPETPIEPTAQAPPVTNLDIPTDPESANLSNVPVDETSSQGGDHNAAVQGLVDVEAAHEVDDTATKRPINAEATHVRAATAGQDAEVSRPMRNEDPEPKSTAQSHLVRELDLVEYLEGVDGANFPEDETPGHDQVDNTAGLEPANAEAADSKPTFIIEGNKNVNSVNQENIESRGPAEFNVKSFVDKLQDRFQDQPEVYKEFLEILQTHQREQTPIGDVYAQVSTLFNSAPDLLEELNQFLPRSTGQAKQGAGPKEKDIPCRNVLIYGRCRYEDQGCAFSHDPIKNNSSSETNPRVEIGDGDHNPVNDDGTDSASQATSPPGAPLIGSTSSTNQKGDSRMKRPSGVYVNGKKVLDLNRRQGRPADRLRYPSPSYEDASDGPAFGQIPPRPGATFNTQASTASAPQTWSHAGGPSDSQAHQHDLGSASVPMAFEARRSENPPQKAIAGDAFATPAPSYLDDAFEADAEDETPRPQNLRRKSRAPAIYVDGKKVRDSNRENSPSGSRRERIVIVDSPPVPRTPPQTWTAPYTAPNALPYATIGPRPVIVDERVERRRVQIEIVDNPRPRRYRHTSDVPSSTRSLKEESTHPRHTSDVPRSTRSLNDDYDEQRRQRRKERKRQKEQEERLRARIAELNDEICGRPVVPARRVSASRQPSTELPDREGELAEEIRQLNFEQERREEETRRRAVKEEGKGKEKEGEGKGPSVEITDREAELVEAVRRLKSEQERHEEESRRLAQQEEGKGKEKEGEGKQPSVEFPNREAELTEALRQLELERERREDKARRRARRKEREEDEIMRRRLMERMMPKRRSSVGPGSRRERVLYDDVVYRWE